MVIFDLDGTLIDSSVGILHATKETLESLHQSPLADSVIRSCIGPPIGDSIGHIRNYTRGQIDDFYSIFRPIYSSKYLLEAEVYPGIIDMLKELKKNGLLLGIATHKRVDYTMKLLEKIGLKEYFDIVEAVDMKGIYSKADLIHHCMEWAGPGCNFTMVGDAPTDINAALSCKIDAVAVLYGFGFKERSDVPLGCSVVETVGELRELLTSL